jgi:hypothetical protein
MRRIRFIVVGALLAVLALSTMANSSCSSTGSKQATDNWPQVAIGQSMVEVTGEQGSPDNKQSFDSAGSHTECWYYGVSHQVCFDSSGNVESKNAY